MKRIIEYIIIILVFILFFCRMGYAQSSDMMNDRWYQRIIDNNNRFSGNNIFEKRRDKRDKDNANDRRYEEEEIARRAAAAEAERRRRAEEEARKAAAAAEAERKRKEIEFNEDKKELLGTMRGINSNGNSHYSRGLKGFSPKEANGIGHSDYKSNLRGISEENTQISGKADYSAGLRGFEDESSSQNRNVSSYDMSESLLNESKTNNPISNSNRRDFRQRADVSNNHYASSSNQTKSFSSQNTFIPQPIYYHGPFNPMGLSDDPDYSVLDRIETKIDIWREKGKHKFLTYIGDKCTGFARQTISSSNVIGAQAVKIYNIMKDVAGLKHMEENIVIRNFDAIKKTIITGNTQYVNEVNRYTENEVVNYRNKLLSDKGIIPPGSSQIPQKAKKITNEVVEVGTKEAIAKAWIKK